MVRARREALEKGRRAVYMEAVQAIGKTTFLVNALEEGGAEPSFGGAMVVSGEGDVLAESPHGSDEVLVYEL